MRYFRSADARVEVDVLQRAGVPAQRDVGIYQQRAGVLHAADHEAGFVPAAGTAQQPASELSTTSATAQLASRPRTRAAARVARALQREARAGGGRARFDARRALLIRQEVKVARAGEAAAQRCGPARSRGVAARAQAARERSSQHRRLQRVATRGTRPTAAQVRATTLTRLSHAALAHGLRTGRVAAVPDRTRYVRLARRAPACECESLLIAPRRAAFRKTSGPHDRGVATAGSRGCTCPVAAAHSSTALPPDSFSLASSASASSFFRPFLITAGALSTCARAIGAGQKAVAKRGARGHAFRAGRLAL